ncbi:MAG TPA: hypothetical protein DEQ34_08325 [Balneolaceae bacterium]|nr:hypothetical protein [Balneolaceae bacterium]|tara:strand:+ start:111125 stop:112240 length:1116 start_codon:yes stop_codon:yes gene_type:complete
MSLGKDLATIRKGLGLTLEEIQNAIKIPTHILKSIEDDSIYDSEEHNTTYIRSFIRSYARGLKIDDDKVVAALDATEAGIYDHNLLTEDDPVPVEKTSDEPFNLSEVKPPEIEQAPSKPTPTVENINWADMGKRFTLQDTDSRIWFFLIIAVFVIVLGAVGFYFRGNIAGWFSSSEEPVTTEEQVQNPDLPEPVFTDETPSQQENDQAVQTETLPEDEPAEEVTNTDDADDEETPENTVDPNLIVPVITQSISQLDDTLSVIVYAAFDKLEPVRVTSDLNGRTNPFWMEPGEAYIFDFADTLRVRGQYSRMLLMFNGHVIEEAESNYYDETFDSIILTRSIFENDMYKQEASQDFPYEVGAPDSVVYRIRY